MKKIIFLGSGNVATHLGRRLREKGYQIEQVFSRSSLSAKGLAEELECTYTTDIESIFDYADYYIFSIKDSVLEKAVNKLRPNAGIWLHTSGSVAMDVFEEKNKAYGVLYPLQTFSKNRNIEWANLPIFIEGSTIEIMNEIMQLAASLSDHVSELSSNRRKYLHISAIFACNFTNHMYNIASKLTEEAANLPFEVLLPLIDETCKKIHELSPQEAQTGPAIRYDENIIDNHLSLLENQQVKNIYKQVSESIHDMSK